MVDVVAERAQDVADRIGQQHALAVAVDVSQAAAVAAMVERIVST